MFTDPVCSRGALTPMLGEWYAHKYVTAGPRTSRRRRALLMLIGSYRGCTCGIEAPLHDPNYGLVGVGGGGLRRRHHLRLSQTARNRGSRLQTASMRRSAIAPTAMGNGGHGVAVVGHVSELRLRGGLRRIAPARGDRTQGPATGDAPMGIVRRRMVRRGSPASSSGRARGEMTRLDNSSVIMEKDPSSPMPSTLAVLRKSHGGPPRWTAWSLVHHTGLVAGDPACRGAEVLAGGVGT